MPLPSTGEAPVPAELPNTGSERGTPLLLLLAALGLLVLGSVLLRRRQA